MKKEIKEKIFAKLDALGYNSWMMRDVITEIKEIINTEIEKEE